MAACTKDEANTAGAFNESGGKKEETKLTNSKASNEKEGWTLTFEDTFEGEQLDPTKWAHAPEWERHDGQWSNQEDLSGRSRSFNYSNK